MDAVLFRVYTSVMSFKKTLCRNQINQISSLASVRTTWYSVQTLISQQHRSGRRELFVRMPINVVGEIISSKDTWA